MPFRPCRKGKLGIFLTNILHFRFDDDDARKRLADCHLALGEQAMEDEEFVKAITELETCIEMYKKEYSADDRRIAVRYVVLYNFRKERVALQIS